MALISSAISLIIDRTLSVVFLLAAVMFAGVVSYSAIPIESDPDVSVPAIIVQVFNEGISPEDAERLLVRPLELELRRIEGIEELNSYAMEGSALLVVEFDSSFEQDKALRDVKDAVDTAKAKLPTSAEEPLVREISVADEPMLTISVAGPGLSYRERNRLAEDIRDEIETITEVLETTMRGEREEQLEAIIDPSLLEAHGISNNELFTTVANNNRLIAAGFVDTGRGNFSVKVPSVIETAADVLSIPIKATRDGVVTLGDVVTLRRTFKDARGFTRINGLPAVVIEVLKRPKTSVVDVVQKVKALLEAMQPGFPKGVEVSYITDMSKHTLEQVNSLEGNITTAVLLVLMVVIATVGVRSGLLVAFSIPFSFLFAFTFLNLIGYTYNMMIMFGMLLGLGMLIDGAIVVVELADRQLKDGKTPKAAYVYATRRMFLPVLASAGTTLAAFLPLLFWPGVVGEFMRYLPVTVLAVLVGALIYALLFAPVLGAMTSHQIPKQEGNVQLVDEGRFDELRGAIGWYAKVLHFSTTHALLVIGMAVTLLVGVFGIYLVANHGNRLFVSADPSHTMVSVSAKGNFSATETRDIMIDVERRLLDVGYIESIYTRSGSSFWLGSAVPLDSIGSMFIELSDRHSRDLNGFEVEDAYSAAIQDLPGVRAEVIPLRMGPPGGKSVQLQLIGADLDILVAETRRVRAHLEQLDGLIGVDDTSPLPGIEWQVRVDRPKAAMAGASVSDVGAAIQLITNGLLVSKYRPDDVNDEVDIRIRYPEEYRSISQLDQLRVATRGGLAPISSFIERLPRPKVSTIFRQDGHRVMYIRANTPEGVLPSAMVIEIQAWLDTQKFDPSISIAFRGSDEDDREARQFIAVAFTLALMLMGIMLITQFNNIYQAVLILSAVTMSTIGVLLGLLVTGLEFSTIMTGVGIVALAGIIVNNNIVLIDTFNYLRRENPGWDLQRVIVTTGCQRLRPVFLTTFTTGFGLLPMATGISVDLIGRDIEVGGPVASFWVHFASAIVSGLSFATILTLIVTPALLIAPEALHRHWENWKGKLFKKTEPNLDDTSPASSFSAP